MNECMYVVKKYIVKRNRLTYMVLMFGGQIRVVCKNVIMYACVYESPLFSFD